MVVGVVGRFRFGDVGGVRFFFDPISVQVVWRGLVISRGSCC